jgi:hypothetical protein
VAGNIFVVLAPLLARKTNKEKKDGEIEGKKQGEGREV